MAIAFAPIRNAALVLADGSVFLGYGIGAQGITAGEVCFTTSMTGYQETLTDPSFAGQIITFTFPHIGNVGCNDEDIESVAPKAAGLIVRETITEPSNFRANEHLQAWLVRQNITGICGIDTRALTAKLRETGAQNGAIVFDVAAGQESDPALSQSHCGVQEYGAGDNVKKLVKAAKAALADAPDMNGLELAAAASRTSSEQWNQARWELGAGFAKASGKGAHVVAIDYGQKHNIARNLASLDCRVTIIPATASAKEILALKPDGVFLSNGPGDPAATGEYALPVIRALLDANVPIFGICLGHQLLGLALGARTEKMAQGHRGANHPIKNLATGKVEITAQNHGFAVAKEGLPSDVEVTHISLFDGTIAGLRHTTKPAFSVQYHPESSPGPHDSRYLFAQFVEVMELNRAQGSEKKVQKNA